MCARRASEDEAMGMGMRPGGKGGKRREEKKGARFAAVGRDVSRWVGNGWDVN